MSTPQVAILIGSTSDSDSMAQTGAVLDEFGVSYETRVLSAHRTPHDTSLYIQDAEARGIQVFIAGAGYAAHLAGVVAAHTTRPVIGVPLASSPLAGVDALYSTVQMPGGVPVATMTIGAAGAKNAGLFAVQILSCQHEELREQLRRHREAMRAAVLAANPD